MFNDEFYQLHYVVNCEYAYCFQAVPSLKYLSRLKVRQSVGSSAHLDVLPLPRTLSDYVKKCPFYDPDLVNAVINNACVTKISNMHDDVISLDHMIDDDGDLER